MSALNIPGMGLDGQIEREWLVANGLGGFASSTICGLNTRKYHGLLVAAMAPPVRRMVVLSHAEETVHCSSGSYALSCNEYPAAIFPQGYKYLRAFNAAPFPRWAYQADGFTIERSLHLFPGENTVCLTYCLLGGDKSVRLEVRPLLAMRGIHELMYQWSGRLGAEPRTKNSLRVPPTVRTPEVFFAHDGEFREQPYWYLNTIYRQEQQRGYSALEDLWSPGLFHWTLAPGQCVHFVCSIDPVNLERVKLDLARKMLDLARPTTGDVRDETLELLTTAASAFIVERSGKPPTETASDEGQASGPYVIAQYPWSSPEARSALIGFNGLFLVTGRYRQARRILQRLAGSLRDGLLPSKFLETCETPPYEAADNSLWFINAISDYVGVTGDFAGIANLVPVVLEIIAAYRRGTRLGIGIDTSGLLVAGTPGSAITWMDARISDWGVTPRIGRPVEINALWYNALRIAASLAMRANNDIAVDLLELAKNHKTAFNERFWNPNLQCCFDVIEDYRSDASIRPNQLLAISLTHPVLSTDRHEAVLKIITEKLLTPFGLRTLAPEDSAYRGQYSGDILSRDRAQHQGSAYPWLLGSLCSTYLRIYGRSDATVEQVRQWLQPNLDRLQRDGLGQIPELFDGDEPQHAGGAIASAASVAEILRSYARDVLAIPAAPIGESTPTTTADNSALATGPTE